MEEQITVSEVFWLIGIAVSAQCLLIQLFLFIVLPSSRKLDQKILTQLTLARLCNVIFEYFVMHGHSDKPWVRDALFALYMQSDVAMICWMFVFTKNLYDKVILVFSLKKISFILVSMTVWLLSLPAGILFIFFLCYDEKGLSTFYNVYAIVKFVILSLNLLLFCRIFYVALCRWTNGDVKRLLKTCIISFILFSITSLQVLLTDIMSFLSDYFKSSLTSLNDVFSVVNSFQIVLITVLFVILSKPCDTSLKKAIVLSVKGLCFKTELFKA